MKIKKAILPVAGFGTRFLPATKAQPKEMMPVVDKPVIQYLVEEAVASGIEEIIFVTGQGKRAIEDHFDHSFELEYNLIEKGKTELLNEIKKISEIAKFSYVRQKSPRGDGDAILQAKHLVGDEPCAVLFGDDIVDSEVPALRQLINVFEKYGDPVIALERVPLEKISKYGVVAGTMIEERVIQIKKFVEKPKKEEAPSDLAVIGKYIITPEVFDKLSELSEKFNSKKDELRLADAFTELLKSKPLYGYEFEGVRYDCGDKIGFLKATVSLGLKHAGLNGEFREYLKNLKL